MRGAAVGEATIPPAGNALPLKGRLFRNDLQAGARRRASLRFTDVTAASGIDAAGYGMGAATGDVDNDGCVDLYLTNFGPNQLFRNNCDGTFTDVSRASGADDPGWSVSASFLDYDRDGWLDLYVGNYVQCDVKTDKPCTGLTGRRDYCTPQVYVPQPDRLYRNRGNGTFEDVTAKALTRRYLRAGAGGRRRRLRQRRLDRHLRRERRRREPALDEPAQRHLQEHRRCSPAPR